MALDEGLRLLVTIEEKRAIRQAAAMLDTTMSAFGRKYLVKISRLVLSGESNFFALNGPFKQQNDSLSTHSPSQPTESKDK